MYEDLTNEDLESLVGCVGKFEGQGISWEITGFYRRGEWILRCRRADFPAEQVKITGEIYHDSISKFEWRALPLSLCGECRLPSRFGMDYLCQKCRSCLEGTQSK